MARLPSFAGKQLKAGALVCLVVGAMAGATSKATPDRRELTGPSKSPSPPQLRLIWSFVWDGQPLEAYNLNKLSRLRKRLGEQPVVHFISPAYFLRGSPQAVRQNRKILKKHVEPGDGVGLLLSGWRSFTQGADVIFRGAPTFWGGSLTSAACREICGQSVPVSVYPRGSLARMFQTGVETLTSNGFPRPTAYLAEGWTSSAALREAAVTQGFGYDFSAIAPESLRERLGEFPLQSWVETSWASVDPKAGLFTMKEMNGTLVAVPQTVAPVSYNTAPAIRSAFRKRLDLVRESPGKSTTFHLVVYQSTAAKTAPTLRQLAGSLRKSAQKAGVELSAFPGDISTYDKQERERKTPHPDPVAH